MKKLYGTKVLVLSCMLSSCGNALHAQPDPDCRSYSKAWLTAGAVVAGVVVLPVVKRAAVATWYTGRTCVLKNEQLKYHHTGSTPPPRVPLSMAFDWWKKYFFIRCPYTDDLCVATIYERLTSTDS